MEVQQYPRFVAHSFVWDVSYSEQHENEGEMKHPVAYAVELITQVPPGEDWTGELEKVVVKYYLP